MAKRKRLNPIASVSAPLSPVGRAPIADVVGDVSARAALEELTSEMASARAEGRLAQDLPLEEIDVSHLLRDRMGIEDEDMAALVASIRARGQQVPIEVSDLGSEHAPLRYGLISGWRRFQAVQALWVETEDPRFAKIRAILRKPEGAADAYLAMVEENEIRAGLSYYERARVAARAAEAGVFPNASSAIGVLFAAASKAKRSKIGSFVRLYEELDDCLRYATAIPERLGLRLAQAMAAGRTGALRIALAQAAPETAQEEISVLMGALQDGAAPATKTMPAGEEVVSGIQLKRGRASLVLTGPGVDAGLEAALRGWLKTRT